MKNSTLNTVTTNANLSAAKAQAIATRNYYKTHPVTPHFSWLDDIKAAEEKKLKELYSK